MWTNSELKGRAKVAMKANYWMTVLVAFILTLITGSGGGAAGGSSSDSIKNVFEDGISEDVMAIIIALLGIVALIIVVMTVVDILVFNPLKVGCAGFFSDNAKSPAELSSIGKGFNPWGRNVLSMFLTGLFLVLWSMLFVIPGIIKSYSYRMVPYILADDPEISAMDAITRSRELMNGNKWKAFVLDLSFLGWWILSVITCGILAVFYVHPYYECTCAELYYAVKGETTGNVFENAEDPGVIETVDNM